jgi:nucleotide-binding universal stress UspA family protein
MKTKTPVIADFSAATSATTEQTAQIHPTHIHLNEILVPLDLSEMSFKALEYAVSFAAQYGARLTLLHVLGPATMATALGPAPVPDSEHIPATEQKLNEIRRNRIPASIAVDIVVRTDLAADGILNAAAELEPDMIVLATHGRTGLERMFLGSTAEKVVRTASCPVLVVRDPERDFV